MEQISQPQTNHFRYLIFSHPLSLSLSLPFPPFFLSLTSFASHWCLSLTHMYPRKSYLLPHKHTPLSTSLFLKSKIKQNSLLLLFLSLGLGIHNTILNPTQIRSLSKPSSELVLLIRSLWHKPMSNLWSPGEKDHSLTICQVVAGYHWMKLLQKRLPKIA